MKPIATYLILLFLVTGLFLSSGCERDSSTGPEYTGDVFPLFLLTTRDSQPVESNQPVTEAWLTVFVRDELGTRNDFNPAATFDDSACFEYVLEPFVQWMDLHWVSNRLLAPGSEHILHIQTGEAGERIDTLWIPTAVELDEMQTDGLLPGDLVTVAWTPHEEEVKYRVYVNGIYDETTSVESPWVQLQWYPDSTLDFSIETQRFRQVEGAAADSVPSGLLTSLQQTFTIEW